MADRNKEAAKVDKFVQKMGNPIWVCKIAKEFHKIEPRDIAYCVSMKLLKDIPEENDYNVLCGVKIILLTWNMAYSMRMKSEHKEDMDKEILSAYRDLKDDFNKLQDEKLETIKLDDFKTINIIKKIFDTLVGKNSIKTTGATKIMHLLNPNLFMMWDKKIRDHYHSFHRYQKRNHKFESSKCYIEFLKDSKIIAKGLADKKDEITIGHSSEDSTFAELFPFQETLPKIIDECNYVIFTKQGNELLES